MLKLKSAGKRMLADYESLKNKLEKQKELFDLIIDNISHGVIIIDGQSRIIKVNNTTENLFYLEKEKISGSKTILVFNNKKLEDLISMAFKENRALRDEITFYGDEDIVLEVQVLPGELEKEGAVLLFRNTTQEADFSRLRSQFVANISHEMRTPLTSMRGYVETAIENRLDEEMMGRYLLKILEEINRLSYLIEDILDLSNIEYKRNVVLKQSYNIVRIISDCIESLSFLAEKNDVRIDFKFEKDPVKLYTDEELFGQLVKNMIENTIFHAGRNVVLKISLKENVEDIVLSFSDNGIGIQKEDLPYIFQRFYKGKNPGALRKISSGLGLAIVKHTIDLHKGKIEVSSVPGKETCFNLIFPKIKI